MIYPGMFDNPVILNLHYFYGIPISIVVCQASLSGRQKTICGCPPSFARTQNLRNRHFGEIKNSVSVRCFLFLKFKIYKMLIIPVPALE